MSQPYELDPGLRRDDRWMYQAPSPFSDPSGEGRSPGHRVLPLREARCPTLQAEVRAHRGVVTGAFPFAYIVMHPGQGLTGP